ncbi:M23 family metallopeptidase [Candidatus Curtissbacteria bacterium]|nr:M23 family metallopeptidase [Candidatus Curtissbacteria bacterium]
MYLKQIRKIKKIKQKLAKIAKMEAKDALILALKFLHTQVKIRPRIRFILFLVATLAAFYFVSGEAAATLREKEAEIKINGQSILVAEKTEDPRDSLEIDYSVGSKRSPFDFQRPVEHGYISQGYRSYHRAIDIATDFGAPIRPLGAGKVEFAGRVTDGKGNIVIVDHGDNLKSLYAHMGKISVGVGDGVDPSMTIGTVGLSGRTTGAHVHLEIYDNDNMVNPASILPN